MLSMSCSSNVNEEDDYKPGECIILNQNPKFYPGEIIEKIQDSYSVNVTVPAGKYWRWPETKDQIFYEKEKIV